MNKRQKELLQVQVDNEKAVLKKLKENYQDALDEINSKIELLMARQDADMQHVIYQLEFQKALKKQVQAILETLQNNEFETVSEYLTKSYEDGFIGTMYELQGSGIPLVFPIDQEQVLAAIQHETKLSESLYTALGKDITDLRKKIAGEISRGISTGMMSAEIARNISSWARIPMNNAMRIARTESNRIQNKAIADAQFKAKDKGADIVKIWSAALDSRTRSSHRKLDGQIRELEEPFEVDGRKVMQPGAFGRPEEDCNCRCRCNSKARWLLGNAYTKWSEDAPIVISDDGTAQLTIIEAKNYKEFQQKYIKASEQVRSNVQKMKSLEDVADMDAIKEYLEGMGLEITDKLFESDCSPQAIAETLKGVEAMFERYPQLRNTVKGIDLGSAGVATYSNGYLNLNPYYYAPDEDGYVDILDTKQTSYHPKGAGAFQTGCHESGHALCDTILYQDYSDYASVVSARDSFAKSVVTKAAKTVSNGDAKTLKQLKETISGYALKNNDECIAEAIADCMCNGEQAAEFSKAIVAELERRLK